MILVNQLEIMNLVNANKTGKRGHPFLVILPVLMKIKQIYIALIICCHKPLSGPIKCTMQKTYIFQWC